MSLNTDMQDDVPDQQDAAAPDPPGNTQQTYGDPVEPGYLLDPRRKPAQIGRYLREMWESQTPNYNRVIVEAEVNERRRSGDINIWAVKSQDENRWQVYVPHGSGMQVPVAVLNKPNRLCYKLVAQLYADPADPEAEPTTGEDQDRDAAEFSTRVLADIGSEAGLNDLKAHKIAMDTACSWGSGYIRYFTDPKGGGRAPMTVLAHPMALDVDSAVLGPDGMPAPDSDLTTRYVREDGSLTDQPADAALRWMPKVVRQVATPGAVRLWPSVAEDVWEAEAVLYGGYETVATLKQWFPALEEQLAGGGEGAVKSLIEERPTDFKHLLPKKMGKPHDPQPKDGHEEDGLAPFLLCWYQECGSYPDGAFVGVVGKDLVVEQSPWIGTVEGKREKRDLPWTQVKQFRGAADHPSGEGIMHFFGPAGEFTAELYGRMSDHLEKLLNRKVFVPVTSTYQGQAAQFAHATHIPIPQGGEPKYEDVPSMPRELPELLDRVNTDLYEASGLGQAGEGAGLADVQSGRHALAVVAEKQAGLADVLQNANEARVRGWRIQLQCVRYDIDVPQILRWQGEDGLYKVRRWSGADLGSTRDVRIKRGTGTMMNAIQRVQVTAEFGQLTGVPAEEIQDLIGSGVNRVIGLQDDPHRQRIRRQLAEWEEGPPEGWVSQAQPPQPIPDAYGLASLDPMTGQMAMTPPVPDPILAGIWEPTPADALPIIAPVRLREIARAMAKKKYLQFPPEWRAGLDGEFARLQQAMQPPPQVMPGQPPPGAGASPGANADREIPNAPAGTPSLSQGEAAAIQPQGEV